MWHRSKQYALENWGAPFVLLFIILLLTSAIYLSFGDSSRANSVALYAFYALVLGVILQIVSFIKYGEGKESQSEQLTAPITRPSMRVRPGRKVLALLVIIVVLVAAGLGTLYYKPNKKTHTTLTTNNDLVAGLNFISMQGGPNNSEVIVVGINETGGVYPFNYTAYWSDNFNQTNEVGVFVRSFHSQETIPDSLKVNVTSYDGQTFSVFVKIPTVNRTLTSSSSSFATIASSYSTTGN